MTGITEAALAERNAQNILNKASSEWRAAWWQTTMVLSAVPVPQAKAAVRQAEVILGQTSRYLSQRRVLGQRLARYTLADVSGLPPRLALLYILTVKADPARIREVLDDAQKRGLSLRDLARELGSQPDSWKRQDERKIVHRSEAAAVIAALDALGKAVTVLASAPEPADPREAAEVADRARALQPSLAWLAGLDAKISAA